MNRKRKNGSTNWGLGSENVLIKIGNFEFTEVWDGVFYKKLADYLKDKVIYIENDCKDIWDWSEKVYSIIEKNHD